MDTYSEGLRLYGSVTETPVEWLWFPYIPFGKVTLLQGDPGGGKSTLMMNIIAAASTGSENPDGIKLRKPMHVIYQCSEDNPADTIKPRLVSAGADCNNVAFLDEDRISVSLDDDVLRRAIADFHARLLVIDPLQAYIGDTDMANAASLRKVLRKLGTWATAYECAIVLVGHLNKKQGSKDLYRGIGSVDLVAAARSVLQIEVCEDTESRMLRQVKCSLSKKGPDRYFRIEADSKIKWDEPEGFSFEDETVNIEEKKTKQERTAEILQRLLRDGPVKMTEVKAALKNEIVSDRTLMNTKKSMGVESFRKDGCWYWALRNQV